MPRLDIACDPRGVAIGVKARTKQDALAAAVDLLAKTGQAKDRDGLLKAVIEREALAATGIGEGCAIPHAKTDLVTGPGVAALRLAKPIEFGDATGAPVRLIFLIVSGRDQAGEHLRLLSKLARMLSNKELRTALERAKDDVAFRNILIEADPASRE